MTDQPGNQNRLADNARQMTARAINQVVETKRGQIDRLDAERRSTLNERHQKAIDDEISRLQGEITDMLEQVDGGQGETV